MFSSEQPKSAVPRRTGRSRGGTGSWTSPPGRRSPKHQAKIERREILCIADGRRIHQLITIDSIKMSFLLIVA